MEYWWAERSISSMINEKTEQTNSNFHNDSISSLPRKENEKKNLIEHIKTNQDIFKSQFSYERTNSKKISENQLNMNTLPASAMSIAASIFISSSKSKMPLYVSNNLQPCFS